MYVGIGDSVEFSKTVSETDIYMFAGITGDFSGNHVDEEYMKRSKFGQRIAHGALLVGFMSTASNLLIEAGVKSGINATPISLGYDRIRFVYPVFIGDTITVNYKIVQIDEERDRATAEIVLVNQNDETVAVAHHILKWIRN